MGYTFRVYLSEDREYFAFGKTGGQEMKKDFAFSQSLLDLFYLDIWSHGELFNGMRRAIHALYVPDGENEKQNMAFLRDSLDTLAGQHIYFEWLKLSWNEKLDKYEAGDYASRTKLLPHKEISHIPSNIHTMQEQIGRLFEDVLDVRSPQDKPVQVKMAEFYKENRSSFDTFCFEPLPVGFEEVEGLGFMDVLRPASLYDMIDFFLRESIKRKQLFKLCKNCNRYFPISGYTNTEYCDREYVGTGKTCKEIGATQTYKRKIHENPIIKEYNREYKKRFAWIRYRKITQDAFYAWSKEAQAMRDRALFGEISFAEFKEWLEG